MGGGVSRAYSIRVGGGRCRSPRRSRPASRSSPSSGAGPRDLSSGGSRSSTTSRSSRRSWRSCSYLRTPTPSTKRRSTIRVRTGLGLYSDSSVCGLPCATHPVPRGGHSSATRHRETRVVVVPHACSLRLDHPDCVLGKRRGQRVESIRAASWCPSPEGTRRTEGKPVLVRGYRGRRSGPLLVLEGTWLGTIRPRRPSPH